MPDPRRVFPEQIHMVSARCSERRFFLKPCKATTEIFSYALARALELTSVELYALVVLSNHYHAMVGDPKAELPKFTRLLNLLTSRALNAHYGRGERLWSSAPYSNVEIHDEETLIRELVYLYTNPVKDGLVSSPEAWPGLHTTPEDMGVRTQLVKRPEYALFGSTTPKFWVPPGAKSPSAYRRAVAEQLHARERARAEGERIRQPRTTLPAELPLEIKVPFLIEPKDREAFKRRVRIAVDLEVEEIHARRRAEGQTSFLGAAKIRALTWSDSAGDSFPSFGRNPRVASGNQDGERQSLLRGLKAWREAYRSALAEWRAGNRDVEFPLGAYSMRTLHHCNVATEPILLG
ncbi:MAG: hypothetical protein KDD82_08675 [Planctomycetes bacterium]|nr:hypothetical protein [Planctomycetota bacterium]